MMNKLKSKILIIISSVMIIASIFVVGVEAFYRFYYQNNGSKLSLVEVVFTVNDSNIKNTSDVVYFSTDEMSQGDGYEITLNYSINGTFSSTNAVKYSTFFNGLVGGEDSDGRDLTLGIEVYRFNSNRYEYLGTLNSLLYENSNKSVLTDYLGSSGTNREKFMLVYGEATKVKDRTAFALQVSTSSEVVTTDSSDFPYYYLSNLGKNSAESILEQLPRNNAVYGRTIVLMRDIDYHGANIEFDHVVGIDLNGHTLNLNGASITITDTAEEETSFISNLGIINSKESGSVVDGIIKLDLTKTVLDVELPLTNYVEAPSINFDVFNEIVQNNLNEIASQKRLMNTESNNTFSYQFDVLKNLKYYIKKGTVTLDASASDFYVSFDSTNYTFKAEGLDTSNIVYVSVATAYDDQRNIANANLSLYGKSLEDAVDYIKSYIPVTIDGSIYLPQYLPAFNTYVTWVAFDSSLIDGNGTVLPNGYINLDSWVTKNAKLGFILDQSGEIKNGIIDNITIEILSEEERAKLLHDFSITMFDYYNVTSYSFDTIDMIMYKRGKDISVDNLASFNAIKEVALSDFGIDLDYTYPTTTISQLKEEFKIRLFAKLGIDEITVSTINESNYVANDVDANGSITLAHQLNLPKDTLDLIYTVNYKFLTGNTVTENKTIAVSNGENSTTATDITNTIRVPFDTYTRSMTTPITTDPYLYEKFVDTFELVSDFSGTPVNYTVDDEFKDYVEILTIDGKKYVHILTGKSPSKTTKVKVYYDIAGTTNSVDFTLVGILHNGKEIVDANLYVELLAQYDVNKDNILTILEAEHAEGDTVDWSSKGIVSLKGLRYFTNIKILYLHNNKIIDISDLAYLYNLVEFKARNNYITDISALEYLDNLSKLNLRNNQITDISPIKGLTNLTELNLEFNKISDFRYVQDMIKLKKLRVFNNVSTTGISTVGTDSTDDGFLVTRRSNQYYFALLAALTNNCNIIINSTSSANATNEVNPDATTFNNNTKQEALILKKIVTVSEVDNVISLPTYININNNNYEITYFVDSVDSPYVSITRDNDVHVTNVTINQIPVDNEVTIYANTVGLDVNAIYRKITFVILEGGTTGKIQLKDTNGNYFYVYANNLIPDVKLRAQIFKTFDADGDGMIMYDDELTATTELDLEFAGIKSLEGLQFFTNITSLNIRGNVLTNPSDLWYVSYLQNLTTLMVDGQEFDFDYLVYFSRKDSTTYDNSNDNIFTVTDVIALDHSVEGTYGLHTLTTLKVNGSYNLDDEKVKTELYHVYLNNNVDIYMQNETTIWDPIKDEVSKLLGSMTTSATFVNLNDTVEIAQYYKFYLYDDLLPTEFSLAYSKPTDAYYRNEYGNKTDDPVTKLYYIDENSSTVTNIGGSPVGNHGKISTEYLFDSTTSGGIITLTYVRLSAFDLTTYANMKLSLRNKLWNSKTIVKPQVNYALALNVQYNDNYKLYNDIDESDSINNNGGTSLNRIFGSVETMILVVDGLTSQMYGDYHGIFYASKKAEAFNSNALRGFYYSKTDVNGNITYYYKYGNNAAELCNDKEDAISRVENFATTGTVSYDGETQTGKTYSNGFIIYVSQLKKDFNYNGKTIANYFYYNPINIYLCMKTDYADLITDGLQYLPFIEVAQSSNGLKYGDGRTLVNLRAIVDIYGYANLATISTPLPKLEGLYINKFFMTEFANESGLSDGDPSKLISSYFVYMPNLRTFFCRNNSESGAFGTPVTDWSAFLVYAYIPYGQTIDSSFYYLEDESANILDMDNVTIGGMGLQDNYLYYYNPNLTIDSCFVPVYNSGGSLLDVTNYTVSSLTQKSEYNYYLYLYDENGNALSDSVSLFRKSNKNQLNYFYIGTNGANSGTVNQKINFTQVYLNAKDSITTWYFKLNGSYTNALPETANVTGAQGDWDPEMVGVAFEPNPTTEWSEFKDYYGHLDVKLTGQTYNGSPLSNSQFDSINWNSLEYVDTFKNGLKVSLPIKTTEFITSDTELNENREFDITWKMLYLNGSAIESVNISASNATLNGNYYEYTFNTNGYYILVSKINDSDSSSLMYAFSITDKSESNFSTWYEKIKDRTLKYFVFKSGGANATTMNYSSISGISGMLTDNIAKKYFSAIYTIEGIDSLSSLTSLTINNFFISFIPALPSSIQSIDLQNNKIGDIGNILDGVSYPNLSTVDISNNLFSLKESNFKNDSYYKTKITSLKLYAPSNFECFINSTQIGYFNNITYVNPINIYFKNELFYYYGTGAQNALPYESITALKTFINKSNVSVYVNKSRWGDEATKLNISNITNLENVYNAIGNPNSRVTSASNAYTLSQNYAGATPTVAFVWDGYSYYEKMVKAYYQLAITIDGYTIVKELFGTFAVDASSYSAANINGITIGTLQSSIDHRVLEGIYQAASFGSDANAYTGTFTGNGIQLSSGSLTLDLKGLNQFSNLSTISCYYGAYFDEIINYNYNTYITNININSNYAMIKSITDTTGNVTYTFGSPISRDLININSSGDFVINGFNPSNVNLSDIYNYCLTNTFTISSFKTQIYNEIVGSESDNYYSKFSTTEGYVANLTSLHINKGIRYYGASLYANSVFKKVDKIDILEKIIKYSINVDTNAKRVLTNGAYMSPDENSSGKRYVLLKTNTETSEIHFPLSVVINGQTITLSYSSTSGIGLDSSNNKYLKMTPGSIITTTTNIIITVSYTSSLGNGSFTFYVDVKTGSNVSNDSFNEAITNWFVEMQDGSLVHAGDVFSSAVLTANIFNGIAKITFSNEITTEISEAVSSSNTLINGNLIMDEVIVDGVLSKVLRQSVISQIKSINIVDRVLMYFDGLEIFYNCKSLQLCAPKKVGNKDNGGGAGYDFTFASNMQLETFIFYHKRNSIFAQDFSFLNNSRTTLKCFKYGQTENGNELIPFQDMSWLLAFDNLETVEFSGPDGIQNNPTFQYFLTAMYLKHHSDIVTYKIKYSSTYYNYSNLNISDDIKSAATIMYDLSSFDTSSDSSFIYQNGFELFSKNGTIVEGVDYYLPSYLYSAGDYYKIEWNSLSSFVDINVINNNNVITVVKYENLYKTWKESNPDSSDYDFCKDYQIKLRFKNLSSTTSYKAFVSMKIEYESKFTDDYAPATINSTELTDNYANYYTASYNALSESVEFVKNMYYVNDGGNYKLLLVKPDDWSSNYSSYYEKVFTQCSQGTTYNKNIIYYTRYIYEPHMFERILTINLAKNNIYEQYLIDNDAYSHADYVTTNANIYDGTALSGTYYSSVTSSNPEVVQVVEHYIITKETHYFVKDSSNNLIRVTNDNYNTLISDSNYGSNATVYYYFLGRVCSGVGYTANYYRYDSTNDKYIKLATKPSGWTNANSSNYYSITDFGTTTTLGALSDLYANDFNISTKVYGIYLKNPDYTGLVTLTCTLADGSGTETRYVYWQR